MIPERRLPVLAIALLWFAQAASGAELRLTQGTNLTADIAANDGRVLMDLLGNVWVVPAPGGDARRLNQAARRASRPRWSPDAKAVLYESALQGGKSLWRIRDRNRPPERLTPVGQNEQDGAWHPSGERILFAAARHDTGLDIWERDLATRLAWRLTAHPGDESAPAWSADGRHLVYLLHEQGRWKLMLRRFGHEPQLLYASDLPLHAPAWRPDNTLITFLAQTAGGELDLMMLIPSAPPIARVFLSGEDFFLSPVSWRDRFQFIYTADGVIKRRRFSDWRSTTLPFSAAVGRAQQKPRGIASQRPLPAAPQTGGNLVVRTGRLFDGDNSQYREAVDIVIEQGRITAIEDQRNRGETLLIDLANTTVLPGLIDSYAALPDGLQPALGSLLLAFGVTTLVTPDPLPQNAPGWQSPATPGPRLLAVANTRTPPGDRDDLRVRILQLGATSSPDSAGQERVDIWRSRGVPLLAADWNSGLLNGADLLLGSATLPISPGGERYADVVELAGGKSVSLISGAADLATPGLRALQQTRQGRLVDLAAVADRRFARAATLINGRTRFVVGSLPSGLPPGFATQAELLALQAAGLASHEALAAATSHAADALGVGHEIGRVAVGARADLMIVAGDPLAEPLSVAEVIAVVRDGHFYSVASLLDNAATQHVEIIDNNHKE